MPNNNEVNLDRPKARLMVRRPYSIFNPFFDDFMDEFFSNRQLNQSFISPKVNLIDKGDKFYLEAELPGMQKNDIDVEIQDDCIIIKGERKTSEEHKEESYYHKETTYGKIHREIILPEKINTDVAKASYENGILKLELPKSEATKSKKLTL
jgi:HSP20 family protein